MATNWGNLNERDNKIYVEWENKYLPASGKAGTIGGEIIRAMSRIIYRYYNDGDTVDRYYASDYNYSKACNNFLCKHVYGYETLEGCSEYNFEKEVNKRLKFVFDFLYINQQLFEELTDEDCIENAPYEPYTEEEIDDYIEEDEEYDDEY